MILKKRTEKKIVVVTRETRVDHLRKRFNTVDQAKFYVKRRGGKFKDYLAEDAQYKESVGNLESNIFEWGNVQFIDRAYLPNFVFGPEDTVIAIGQDGLVANTLKYLKDGQPLIGVNPDPERWDGVLLPFTADEMQEVAGEVLQGRFKTKEVTMARAVLNDGQEILGVNDLFIGKQSHTSARYMIEIDQRRERHSSSGVIVSTGLGSTGWLKSLLHGASAIVESLGETPVTKSGRKTTSIPVPGPIPWDTPNLYFTVREPFPSQTTQADLVFGKVEPESPLVIRSLMPEEGVIFSDGLENDFYRFQLRIGSDYYHRGNARAVGLLTFGFRVSSFKSPAQSNYVSFSQPAHRDPTMAFAE